MRRRSNTIKCDSVEEYIQIATNNMQHELQQERQNQLKHQNDDWNFTNDCNDH